MSIDRFHFCPLCSTSPSGTKNNFSNFEGFGIFPTGISQSIDSSVYIRSQGKTGCRFMVPQEAQQKSYTVEELEEMEEFHEHLMKR